MSQFIKQAIKQSVDGKQKQGDISSQQSYLFRKHGAGVVVVEAIECHEAAHTRVYKARKVYVTRLYKIATHHYSAGPSWSCEMRKGW